MTVIPHLGMFQPGLQEGLVVLVIVLLLFGAKRLPELARALGKSLSEFKKGRQEGSTEDASAPKPPSDTDTDANP